MSEKILSTRTDVIPCKTSNTGKAKIISTTKGIFAGNPELAEQAYTTHKCLNAKPLALCTNCEYNT